MNSTTLAPGTVLEDKWIVMELIGKGAMGEVYRAHQTNLKRDVAIKVISAEVLSELEDDPEEHDITFGRFQREVQTMARVRHPNVLNIYDYGEMGVNLSQKDSRTAFIVMEYIPGDSLRFTITEDGLDDVPDDFAHWIKKYFLPILDGVEVLHNNGIVHRDLKPENIFLDGEIPKIGDFGLARSYHMKAVTTSIEMLGTLAYMSAEQSADFKNAGYKTDIYALGKILFEAVHGTLTEKILPFTPVSIENPQTDFLFEISEVIQKATAESSSDRYQSISEMRVAVLKALSIHDTENNLTQASAKTDSRLNKSTGSPLKWLIGIAIIAVIAGGATGVYQVLKTKAPPAGLEESTYQNHGAFSEENQVVRVQDIELVQDSINGRDGSTMLLTGDLEDVSEIQPFYMDEHKITNFQFIEFLNSFKDELSVKNGIIRSNGTIISYIGSGSSENEPIFFEHSRFHLKDQSDGDKPAVRVTFHGAHLYAATYGKNLLTDEEWRFAYRFHASPGRSDPVVDSRAEEINGTDMMHESASSSVKNFGGAVLDDMGRIVKEWVVKSPPSSGVGRPTGRDKYEAAVLGAEALSPDSLPTMRAPWEGFDDVGFRTKIQLVII